MDQHGLSGPPPPPQPPPLMNNNGLQNSPRSPISPMGTPVTPVTPNSTDMFHQSAYPSSIIRRMFGQDGNGLGFPMGDMGRHSLPEDFFANAKFAKQIKKEPHQNGSEPMSPKSMANMVHPDRRHICPHCYKGFKSRQQLTQHNLVHSNVRKYKCNYCERAFKQLSHLHQHHRIHTGEKPYKCPLEGCDRAFPQLSNLQHHIRNHDKLVDSKFQCLLCNRAYPNEATLKAHNTRTHLHGKPLDLTQQQQAQRAILQQAKETTAALMAIAKQQEQDSQFPPHLQSHGLSRSHDLSPHGHQNHNGHMLDHHEHQNSGGKSSPAMVDENGMRSSPDDMQEPIKQRKRKASRPQHLYFHPSMADGTENQLSPDENQMDLSEKSTKNKKMVDKNDNIGANGRKDLALYERNHLSHEPQQLKEDRNASRDFNPSAKIQEYMNNPNFMRQKMLELQNGNFLKQSLYNAMEDLSDRASPRSSPHGTNLMNGSSLLKQMAADSRQVENMFPGMGYGNKTFEKVSHSRGIDMNLSALSKFNNSLASSSSRLFMSENSPIYHSSPGLLLSQSHLNQNYPSNPSLSHSGALVHDSITGRGSGGPYSSLKLPAYSSPAWTQGLNRENLGLCNGQEDMGQHRQLIDNVEDRCQDFSSTQMDTFDEPMN